MSDTDEKNQKISKICFFDNRWLDPVNTTAVLRVHEPVPRECVLVGDEPWEGDNCGRFRIIFDKDYHGTDGSYPDGTYRMYYQGWNIKPETPVMICYAESPDGIRWRKPRLFQTEANGTRENNIIDGGYYPFYDRNPACPPDRRYKSFSGKVCYYSEDGLNFHEGHTANTENGHFDNVFWDETSGKYRCYFRGYHFPEGKSGVPASYWEYRDVRYMESEDLIEWTEPVPLDYGDADELQIYTNVVSPYYRCPDLLIGFPTRYFWRENWYDGVEDLCGKENRLRHMPDHPRRGLSTTDCVFMCSYDGVHFKRHDTVFLRPGPEDGMDWVYGDGYPAQGLVETPSRIEGEPNEISIYQPRHNLSGTPSQLWRYTLRLDGFVSLHAGAKEETVHTWNIAFRGTEMYANFSTSAKGYIIFTVKCTSFEFESFPLTGNDVDRRIVFHTPCALQCLSDKNYAMELWIRMKDADLYSIRYDTPDTEN